MTSHSQQIATGNERYEGTEYSFREHVRQNICWYQNTALSDHCGHEFFIKTLFFSKPQLWKWHFVQKVFDWSVMSGGSPVLWFIVERAHTDGPRKLLFAKWGNICKQSPCYIYTGMHKQESFLSTNVMEVHRPFIPLNLWSGPYSRHPLNTLFSPVDSVGHQLH